MAIGSIAFGGTSAGLTKGQADSSYAPLTRPAIPGAFAGMKALLDAGLSAGLGVGGDSTGVGTTRWVYLFGQWLATQYPAATVNFRTWNISTLKWDTRTAIQTGAAGARKVTLDGTTATGLSEGTSSTTYSNITGDIDLRAKIAPTKWSGAASNQTILAKFGNSGQRVYRFQLATNGKLQFDWTADGSTLQAALVSSVAVGAADGSALWVRVGFQVSTGGNAVATFYTSTDGYAWTQLGSAQTHTGTTSLFSTTTQPVELGARSGGTTEMFAGDFYEVEVRNGIDGPIALPVMPEQWAISNSNYNGVLSGAPVIDLWNGSWSGGSVPGTIVPNDAKMVPAAGLHTYIISSVHNETDSARGTWGSYDTLAAYAKATNPGVGIAVTAQNPKTSPSTAVAINRQARLCAAVEGYAAQRGYTLIPVYRAFSESSTALATLTNGDGIHPSDSDGSPLWASTVETLFARR